jgi:hypothetical protein
MEEGKKLVMSKEIKRYMTILLDSRLLNALPDEMLFTLHRDLATSVSLVQHLEEGED